MKKYFFIIITLCIFCFAPSPARAGQSPFKIEIYPDQTSVKSGMMFLVRARVSNATDGSVDLLCYSCSYDKHWITDIPGVFVQPWTCGEDKLEQMTLEPGDIYEKNLILYISKKDGAGPVTFRLGFIHTLENGDQMEPVWSDPVTLRVSLPDGATPVQEDADSGAAQVRQNKTQTIEFSETMPDEPADPGEEIDPDLAKKIP